MAKAADWLARRNAERPLPERLLMAVLQLKAVALAARKFPELNGFWQDGGFKPAARAHLGVAISLRQQGGLIAPAIHDVADKTLEQIMADLSDLVKRARAGSLRSSEMSGPTLTVANLGDGGVEAVFGVIYPPQVALDSMDWLNFLIGLHQKLEVDIPEADYARLVTLDAVVNYLGERLPG